MEKDNGNYTDLEAKLSDSDGRPIRLTKGHRLCNLVQTDDGPYLVWRKGAAFDYMSVSEIFTKLTGAHNIRPHRGRNQPHQR